jgi:hypothetical protein
MKLAQDQIRRMHVLRDPPAYVPALVGANRVVVTLRDKESFMKIRLRRLLPGELRKPGDFWLSPATHSLQPVRRPLLWWLWPTYVRGDIPHYRIDA